MDSSLRATCREENVVSSSFSDLCMPATAGHNSTFKQRMEIFQTDRLKRDDADVALPKFIIVYLEE